MVSNAKNLNDNSEQILPERITAIIEHTRERYDFLLRRVNYDPAEVIMVAALWITVIHRLFWRVNDDKPAVYNGLTAVFGNNEGSGEILTAVMLFLGVVGAMSAMLYLPKLRRQIDLAVGTFFVVHGAILLCMVHDSLFAWIEILIFGVSGAWTFWRQGDKQNDNGAYKSRSS